MDDGIVFFLRLLGVKNLDISGRKLGSMGRTNGLHTPGSTNIAGWNMDPD